MSNADASKTGKKRIVVVCPGRGSYTAETLNYLKRFSKVPTFAEFVADIDGRRREWGEPTITELDTKEKFSPSLHTRGEHASPLIYACSYGDFLSIDREQYEIVALAGNSMGWYLALAFSGVLNWAGAFHTIQTMGSMMKQEIIGAQLIYPIVDENWLPDPKREAVVHEALAEIKQAGVGEAYVSIWLGGYVVLAGEKRAVDFLQKKLPKTGDYPFQLINHAAFHTPLMYETSQRAFEAIPESLFHAPQLPLIDGRGQIWQPYSTDTRALYEYTLGHQVYATYDFTSSITVALKEFAPDQLWLLGPGSSLGGSLGQILIKNQWRGIKNKDDFKKSNLVVNQK